MVSLATGCRAEKRAPFRPLALRDRLSPVVLLSVPVPVHGSHAQTLSAGKAVCGKHTVLLHGRTECRGSTPLVYYN